MPLYWTRSKLWGILKTLFVIAVSTIGIIYVYYTAPTQADYVIKPDLKCNHTPEEMAQLLNITHEVHRILDSMGIDHWLMYGSIFGAIRVQGPLPWDYDVDIGMRGEQFAKIKFQDFVAPFKATGLKYTDHRDRNGLVGISRPGWPYPLGVDIFEFRDYFGRMGRPGWASWLLILHFRLHHSFPARLVKSPLPKAKFGSIEINVPREGVEILKYLYRRDWWKEVKPQGCGTTSSRTS